MVHDHSGWVLCLLVCFERGGTPRLLLEKVLLEERGREY